MWHDAVDDTRHQGIMERRGTAALSSCIVRTIDMVTRPLISIVDDDESVRESLPDLLRELGFDAQAFASADAFLASPVLETTRCLLLDVAMPGMNGPGLQAELTSRERRIPIVFITANADRRVHTHLIAAGALDCLLKPFTEQALLDAITTALLHS